MNIRKIIVFLLLMPLVPAVNTFAQTTGNETSSPAFDMSGFPQWARDLRRWEIVAFGSFPFTMLIATTSVDLYRWNEANGMDFNDMRYAPWPLKSAGAVAMTNREMETTISIAVGLSLAVAVADLIIIKVKQHKARKRAEALPAGTAIITNTPLPDDAETDDGDPPGGDDPP